MMKYFLIVTLFLSFLQLKSQSTIDLSYGVLHSDIYTRDEKLSEANSGKFGYYVSVGYQKKIWKHLHLKTRSIFFNKKPLEVFVFGSSPDVGIPGTYTFANVPTSEQSEGFDPKFDKILKDFRYLSIDILPTFSIERRIKFNLGIGFNYKRLLNFEDVIVRREDVPSFDAFFEPPFSVSGEVHYGKNDYGWTSALSIAIPINKKIAVGLEGNFYHSFRGMHNEPYPAAKGNPKWIVINGGLNLQYTLRTTKKDYTSKSHK